MTDSAPNRSLTPASPHTDFLHPPRPLGVLGLIAGYKLLKALLATTGGIAVSWLGHQNIIHVAHRWMAYWNIDPEGRMGAGILVHLAHIDVRYLQWAKLLMFSYAILYGVEAIGLFLEKRWAEWLTIVQTSLLIPFEIYELFRAPTLWKIVALLLSTSVVLYLLWRIRKDDEEDRAHATIGKPAAAHAEHQQDLPRRKSTGGGGPDVVRR